MLKYTDDLTTMAEAYKRGEVAPEHVHVHLAPRLEFAPEKEARRILNDLELAVQTLNEPNRQFRILAILDEAMSVAASYPAPDSSDT